MDQLRLFRVAPDAINFAMRYEWPTGWSLAVHVHVPGEPSDAAYRSRYDGLTADELFDVVDVECATVLGFCNRSSE